MYMHTLHCTHIKSHLTLRKKSSWPLWLVMMDDSAPTHKKKKLVKTYKNVLPQKRTVVAKEIGRPTPKSVTKME